MSIVPPARAATFDVPGAFPDVAAAVSAASPGDVVDIGPGTWPADVAIPVDLTLRGAGMGVTTLTGPITSELSLTLESLSVTTGQTATCVWVTGPLVHLDHVRVFLCGASDAFAGGLFAGPLTRVEVVDSEFEDNVASDAGHIDTLGTEVELTRSFFRNGTSSTYVGGVSQFANGGSTTVTNCWFGGNDAADSGGGLHSRAAYVTVTGTTFVGNDGYQGGAMYAIDSTSILLDRVAVVDNTGGRAALDIQISTSLKIGSSWLCGNDGGGAGGGGGALRADNIGSVAVYGTAFVGNTSSSGNGAMRVMGGGFDLRHVTFLDSTGGLGGAIGADLGATGLVQDSLFADSSGYAISFGDTGTVVGYDAFVGNTPGDITGSYVDAGSHVIGLDPLLVSHTLDCNTVDVGLLFGSPLIDAGNPLDLADQDGTLPDIGATGGAEPLCALAWFYRDADHDGFGDLNFATRACDLPGGFVVDATDCDDADPNVLGPTVPVVDADGDGYGGSTYGEPDCGAALPVGDCDDDDAARNPGELDVQCNGLDEDCTGTDDCLGTTYTTPTTVPTDTTDPSPTTVPPTGDDDDDRVTGKVEVVLEGGACTCDAPAGPGVSPVVALLLWSRRRRG